MEITEAINEYIEENSIDFLSEAKSENQIRINALLNEVKKMYKTVGVLLKTKKIKEAYDQINEMGKKADEIKKISFVMQQMNESEYEEMVIEGLFDFLNRKKQQQQADKDSTNLKTSDGKVKWNISEKISEAYKKIADSIKAVEKKERFGAIDLSSDISNLKIFVNTLLVAQDNVKRAVQRTPNVAIQGTPKPAGMFNY